ncbi:MAG: protein translocase subunit SecF [Elusimicrobia bacterium]|nr:protein translocase subunit SecF [Elusimicrobiota bacterium]
MELFRKTHIDFIERRRTSFAVSAAIITGGLAAIFLKGFNYSIEFTGGALLQVTFEKPVALGDVRSALDKQGLRAEIQSVAGRPTFILRQKGSEEAIQTYADEMIRALRTSLPDNPVTMDRREYIGPVIGRHLKRQTLWAIGLSLLCITIYIALRFPNPLWAIAGLIAMFHDVVGAAGMIALTGKEMDLLIVSALLTVAGYSIEDTIVIYDRMREMLRIMRRESPEKVINAAINDTLSRTIITVLLVQLICIVLWLFGGEVLRNFGLTLVIGNILGSYSTIAVAAPLIYEWEIRRNPSYRLAAAEKTGNPGRKGGPERT